MARCILVVDDDIRTLDLIRLILEHNNYTVFTALNYDHALKIIDATHLDCALLDVMLTEKSGLMLLQYIRNQSHYPHLPILMLTSKTDEIDTILGLEMGADDYIKKPFNKRELIARIEAVFRRIEMDNMRTGKILNIGNCTLDTLRNTLAGPAGDVLLSPLEFQLLSTLIANPGRIFSREELMDRIWSQEITYDSRTVDVHIRRLRQKLSQDPQAVKLIETVRGYGYRFSK